VVSFRPVLRAPWHSWTRMPVLVLAGTPPRARFATRGRVPSPPRVCCPSPGASTLHTYPVTFSCTCSPLCWRTHLDATNKPSLVVVGSAPAAAPTMDSTRRACFSSSGLLSSCPSEPNGSHEPSCGTCCPATVSPRRQRALPGRRSSGAILRTPGDRAQKASWGFPLHTSGHTSPGPQSVPRDHMRSGHSWPLTHRSPHRPWPHQIRLDPVRPATPAAT
jgi:hypothetical protein